MLPMKKRRRRICLTNAEKAVMWDRWKQGDSLHAKARLLDTSHTSIRRNQVTTGGIRPPQRRWSVRVLTLSEREEISRGIVAGHSIRSDETFRISYLKALQNFGCSRYWPKIFIMDLPRYCKYSDYLDSRPSSVQFRA
jgi:hypothetical protein